ncbi:MAG: hypothetical protein LC768_18605 [Acidobacteria bacterium]|nr:hypothetical protein [Acidobacteriota bacterium]
MNKNFKIARKPGQKNTSLVVEQPPAKKTVKTAEETKPPVLSVPIEQTKIQLRATTRKTIEVPEDYFYMVKMRALQRKILEKELWAEIIADYFQNHPT